FLYASAKSAQHPFYILPKIQTAQAGLPIDCLSIPNALHIDCQWDANRLALSEKQRVVSQRLV
ncbi:MAG TPA: hypothetical protein PL126_08730, partial [Candidatus Cloacimonadota bacterium]|nr:hypothetical protein [Candidatus Cloacimonadota bacterium]